LLAYTNRFLALANLVRKLHDEYIESRNQNNEFKETHQRKIILWQIKNLRRRINLIRYMQGLGVFSFLGCVGCMYSLYRGAASVAEFIFAVALLSLLASLFISLAEIIQSTKAIELELSDIEEMEKVNIFTAIRPGSTE